MKGVVKWFNNEKGFGFIYGEGLNQDIFAHYTKIINQDGRKELFENQNVSFDLEKENNGTRYFANNISVIKEV